MVRTNQQYGYRKGKSTADAVSYTVNFIKECKFYKQLVLGLFLDHSKAFDCVRHEVLLSIIDRYGIRGLGYDLICSYLEGGEQCFQIKQLDEHGHLRFLGPPSLYE